MTSPHEYRIALVSCPGKPACEGDSNCEDHRDVKRLVERVVLAERERFADAIIRTGWIDGKKYWFCRLCEAAGNTHGEERPHRVECPLALVVVKGDPKSS